VNRGNGLMRPPLSLEMIAGRFVKRGTAADVGLFLNEFAGP
jgi:hypothetical protein